MLDLNQNKEKVVLLIHPMLSSAHGMKLIIADHMGEEFRYILPDLSAHGELSNEVYESVQKESERIHEYLVNHHIQELALAYGASLGGVVLLQLLAYKDIKVRTAVFEGCSLWEHAKALNFIATSVFLHKHRKAIRNRELAIKKMTGLYGEKAAPMAERFMQIDEQSLKNIFHDCAFVNPPELSKEEQEACLFLYGSKEFDLRSAKKVLPKKYPYARLKVWDGYGHCTKMSADPAEYGRMLKSEIENGHNETAAIRS